MVEKYEISCVANASDAYVFALSGLKVTTGQIIKLQLVSGGTNTTVTGSILCWEETTAATPVI